MTRASSLQIVLAAAGHVPPYWRSRFLESVADALMSSPTIDESAVRMAVEKVTERFASPRGGVGRVQSVPMSKFLYLLTFFEGCQTLSLGTLRAKLASFSSRMGLGVKNGGEWNRLVFHYHMRSGSGDSLEAFNSRLRHVI